MHSEKDAYCLVVHTLLILPDRWTNMICNLSPNMLKLWLKSDLDR